MMNPSTAGLWNNPPPPGIDIEEEEGQTLFGATANGEAATEPSKKADSATVQPSPPETNEKTQSDRRKRSRSRSHDRRRSKDRSHRRRHKSRSRSRGRYRKSRSRSRGTHKRHRSASRSRSRSSSFDRHRRRRSRDRKHRRSRSHRYSRSTSRSRSRSRTHRHHRSKRHSRERDSDRTSISPQDPNLLEVDELHDTTMEEEEEPEPPKENAFKNDGSFLEMFKKMQEQKAAEEAAKTSASKNEIKKPLPPFGKRRGGRVLKTGMVEKNKTITNPDGTESEPTDAWSIYLKEVKKYKEACCDEDSKTRPLIK